MQLRLSILCALLLCVPCLYAQPPASSCDAIYNTAASLFENGDYALAIKKISAYRVCANTLQNKKADDLLLKIYETIKKQKQDAITAKQVAETQTQIAKTETSKATQAKEEEKKARKKEEAAKKEAIAQRDTATQRLKVMTSRKLLTDAIIAQNETPPQWHLSLLIAEQAMKLSPSVALDATIRKALSKLPILLKEDYGGHNAVGAKLTKDNRYAGINFNDEYNHNDKIVIWDMHHLKPIFTLEGSNDFLFTAKNYLVAGSSNKKALVIDFINNKTICELPHTLSNVVVLAISPDDRYILTQNYGASESGSASHTQQIFVWDIIKQKKINTIKPKSAVGKGYGQVFFFTYKGQLQIGLNRGYGHTDIWNINESNEISMPTINNNVLSENGAFLMSYHPDKNGFQLSAIDGTSPIISINQRVNTYKFSNTYKYLLVFLEYSAQMWDLTGQRKLWEGPNFISIRKEDICFSPNDKYFSLSQSNEVRLVNDGSAVAINYWSETIDSVQVLLGERIKNVAGEGLVLEDAVETLLFSYTGDTVITRTRKDKLLFWEIKPNTQLTNATLQQSIVTAAVAGSKGNNVYLGNYYGVYRYMLFTSQIDTIVQTKRAVRAVDINKDETLLAYGVENETIVQEKPGIYLFDLVNKKTTHIPIDAGILSVQFNKTGNKLLVGTSVGSSFGRCDCGLWLIDLRDYSRVKIDPASAAISYYRASFFKNDNFVLFTTGFEAKLFNIVTKKVVFRTEYGRHILYSEKFRIIAKSKKDALSIYNSDSVTANITLKSTRQFTGEIMSLKLSATEPLALIGIKENYNKSRLVVWNYKMNKELNNFEIQGNIEFADFNVLAPQKVIVCYDNVITEFDLSYNSLPKQIRQRKIRELSKAELRNIVGEEFNTVDFK